jgi:hypothetical protein
MNDSARLDGITRKIIGAAIEVHRALGPGYLNPLTKPAYKSVRLDCGYRPDLVVEDEIVVEIKWVERLNSVHDAQLISYLKLSNRRVGLLINFNVRVLKHGLKRVVNDFPDSARSAVSAV